MSIADGVRLAREANAGMRIEVEVTNIDEAREALEAGADELLLDNMTLDAMREVVALREVMRRAWKTVVLEASGGITLENARAVAETGVDYISMGAITHSAPALDMSLEIVTNRASSASQIEKRVTKPPACDSLIRLYSLTTGLLLREDALKERLEDPADRVADERANDDRRT